MTKFRITDVREFANAQEALNAITPDTKEVREISENGVEMLRSTEELTQAAEMEKKQVEESNQSAPAEEVAQHGEWKATG